MKSTLAILALLSGCYSSRNNETVGQIKKVANITPILCPNYTYADVSLGVMRNGVGSMSHEDVDFYIPAHLAEKTKELAVSGAIVKITYNTWRMTICVPDREMLSIEQVP
jgi:hypothetical protein